MKAVAVAFGIHWTASIWTVVNEPVVKTYKDGEVISVSYKTLPNGSIEVTREIEQIPDKTRKPTSTEKAERMGYIFSTEVGPMVFGALGISKVSKTRYNQLSKKWKKPIKEKVHIVKSKANKAGKARIIKAELKKKGAKVKVKTKTKTQKAKERKAIKKRHEKAAKEN